jgi:hypothetical protein
MPVTAVIHSSNERDRASAPVPQLRRRTESDPHENALVCRHSKGNARHYRPVGTRQSPEEAGTSYHRKERVEGAFSRSVTLPAAFDGTRVDAKYVDGIPR